MATYEGVWIKHATLTEDVVDSVVLGADFRSVEVVNRDGGSEIYFTIDGQAPTVEGDNAHVLPAAIGGVTVSANREVGPTVVRLVSSGAAKYSVRGV